MSVFDSVVAASQSIMRLDFNSKLDKLEAKSRKLLDEHPVKGIACRVLYQYNAIKLDLGEDAAKHYLPGLLAYPVLVSKQAEDFEQARALETYLQKARPYIIRGELPPDVNSLDGRVN